MTGWEDLYPDFKWEVDSPPPEVLQLNEALPSPPPPSHAQQPAPSTVEVAEEASGTSSVSAGVAGDAQESVESTTEVAEIADTVGSALAARPAHPALAAPPALLPLPRNTPTASPPPTPPHPAAPTTSSLTATHPPIPSPSSSQPAAASSPISITSSPVQPSPDSGRRHKDKGKGRADRMPAAHVDLTQESDDEGPDAGRKYQYPLPPDLTLLPERGGQNFYTSHAGDAAFWAVYGDMDSYHQWVRRLAHESETPPPLPPHLQGAGHEMAWAHASIYSRHIKDAKRVVCAQELASQTERNLRKIRELKERVQQAHVRMLKEQGRPSGPLGAPGALGNRVGVTAPGHAPHGATRAPVAGPSGQAQRGGGSGRVRETGGPTPTGPTGAPGSGGDTSKRSSSSVGTTTRRKPVHPLQMGLAAMIRDPGPSVPRAIPRGGPAGARGPNGKKPAEAGGSSGAPRPRVPSLAAVMQEECEAFARRDARVGDGRQRAGYTGPPDVPGAWQASLKRPSNAPSASAPSRARRSMPDDADGSPPGAGEETRRKKKRERDADKGPGGKDGQQSKKAKHQ